MRENLEVSTMDRTKKYLARIGLAEDTPVTKTYEFLAKLQLAHVTTVPYENFDIPKGKPLSFE